MIARSARIHRLTRGASPALRALLAFAVFGCGSSSDPGTSSGGGGSFTASIDGAAWASDANSAKASHPRTGHYVLRGSKITGTNSLDLEIDVDNISVPGTYPLGVTATVYGGIAWVTSSAPVKYWLTENSGAAGTITIAAISDTRIAGTFSYSAKPYTQLGSATGTVSVTSGTFDLPVTTTGSVAAPGANAGSKMSAFVGGTAWNAANVSLSKTSGNLTISGDNSNLLVGIALTSVSGPGTYPITLSPLRILTVSGPATSPTGLNCCWGGVPVVVDTLVKLNDVGTVTITTFSSTRVVGTFGAVLAGVPNTSASGLLTIANGTFDVGIP